MQVVVATTATVTAAVTAAAKEKLTSF
jgi:hypothetical protein